MDEKKTYEPAVIEQLYVESVRKYNREMQEEHKTSEIIFYKIVQRRKIRIFKELLEGIAVGYDEIN